MFDPTKFYSGFQVNYFTYKQQRLKDELENFNKRDYSYKEQIENYDKEEHFRSIKMDIRQTYFQAIETLFSLIIALKPDAHGRLDEKDILIKLSKKQFHYEEIRKFGFEEGGLDFLNMKIKLTNGKELTALHYIFYMSADESTFEEIPSSLEAILYGLKFLAKDISDRREYNSMKHGLRVYRAANYFKIGSLEQDALFEIDLKDSMTFYDKNEKTEEIEFVTKVFDFERDVQMTLLCSNLMSNIIYFRRVTILDYKGNVPIYFFTKAEIDERRKINVKSQNFSYKVSLK